MTKLLDADKVVEVVERKLRYVDSRLEHLHGEDPYKAVPYRLAQQRILVAVLDELRALPDEGEVEDTARLNWLDEQNARINEHYGTKYGWRYDVNHNRAAVLSDNHYPVKTVREAIDEARAALNKQETRG